MNVRCVSTAHFVANPRRTRGAQLISMLALAACGACSEPGPPPVDGLLQNGTRVIARADGGVQLIRDDQRLLATAPDRGLEARQFDDLVNGLVGMWTFEREDESAVAFDVYQGGSIDAQSARITYGTADGGATAELVIEPAPELEATRLRWTVQSETATSLALPVACDTDGSFYGFGEQYHAGDQRGEAFSLFVSEQGIGRDPELPPTGLNGGPHTTYFPMPYYLDARGFGVLIETSRRSQVDLCRGDESIAWLEVIDGAPLELLVFHGPTPLDVIRQLSLRLGRPSAPPSWAYDLWVGSQGGRDAVLAEVDALEAAEVPVGALWVQDWTGHRSNLDGGSGVQYRWTHDEELYPDLAGMIDDLAKRGYRFLSYANPFIDPKLGHFAEMDEAGLLIGNDKGESYVHLAPNGSASHPDLSSKASREYVKKYLRAMVTDYGMDGWMSDFGEWVPLDAVLSDGSDATVYHNRFPIEWHRLWREVMDEVRPDGDFAVFARSGFSGIHAHSQIHWVGDQEADWSPHDGLPTVIPAMLNLGMSGIPYVTHDIGGFSGGPSSKELFMRWVELGAFTPIMRTHEGNAKDENWSWEKDAETTAHFRRFAKIHDALGPVFEALSDEAQQSSAPLLRHLMLMYPNDPESRGTDDQFLIGDSLLVAPVVTKGTSERSVYLPPGDTWFHVWTGSRHDGGQRITIDAPIGSPPIFSRGGDRPELRAID